MLQPNTIPNKEPLLRVGIILPEDQINLVEIELPQAIEYKFIHDDKNGFTRPGRKYKFEYSVDSSRPKKGTGLLEEEPNPR